MRDRRNLGPWQGRLAGIARRACALLLVTSACIAAPAALAYSAIAGVPDNLPATISAAWAYPTQEQADQVALEACVNTARESGVAMLAPQCTVLEHQPVAGFGAIVCGSNGCASGYGTSEVFAVRAAMTSCQSPDGPQITGCDPSRPLQWEDRAFPPALGGGAAPGGQPPVPAPVPGAPAQAVPAALDPAWAQRFTNFVARTYGPFDAQLQCWVSRETANGGQQRFCWRIARAELAPRGADGQAKGAWLLLVADAIDDQGNLLEVSAYSGMVGAYALELRGDALVPRAALRARPMGHDGAAPKEWAFLQVSPTEFGFRAQDSAFTQGQYFSASTLLVPHGAQMADVGFVDGFSDEGMCGDDACARAAVDISVQFELDTHGAATPLYPARLTIIEKRGGIAQPPRHLLARFDAARWAYVMPKDPALQRLNPGAAR